MAAAPVPLISLFKIRDRRERARIIEFFCSIIQDFSGSSAIFYLGDGDTKNVVWSFLGFSMVGYNQFVNNLGSFIMIK